MHEFIAVDPVRASSTLWPVKGQQYNNKKKDARKSNAGSEEHQQVPCLYYFSRSEPYIIAFTLHDEYQQNVGKF